MTANGTLETVLILGVLGAGGYLFYEYSQYSSAMNTLAQITGQTAAFLESVLPFFTWLSFNWGGSGSGTAEQQTLYGAMQSALSGTNITTQAPGTTSPTQTTSVSSAPGTTVTPTASSAPSVSPLTPARTYAPAGSGLAPLSSSRLLAGAISTRRAINATTRPPKKAI